MAQVPRRLHTLKRRVGVAHQHADDAKFRAVVCDQRVHVDAGFRQHLGHPVHGALFVFRKYG